VALNCCFLKTIRNCNARITKTKHDVHFGRWPDCSIIQSRSPRPRITRAEDSGKTIKLIKNGSVVSFEYTIFDENGKVIDSSRGKEPVTYTHGQQQIIPGLEKKLSGMEINEEKNVRLPPEEAFGPVDPNGFQEVPKDNIPAEDLKVETTVQLRGRQAKTLIFASMRSKKKAWFWISITLWPGKL